MGLKELEDIGIAKILSNKIIVDALIQSLGFIITIPRIDDISKNDINRITILMRLIKDDELNEEQIKLLAQRITKSFKLLDRFSLSLKPEVSDAIVLMKKELLNHCRLVLAKVKTATGEGLLLHDTYLFWPAVSMDDVIKAIKRCNIDEIEKGYIDAYVEYGYKPGKYPWPIIEAILDQTKKKQPIELVKALIEKKAYPLVENLIMRGLVDLNETFKVRLEYGSLAPRVDMTLVDYFTLKEKNPEAVELLKKYGGKSAILEKYGTYDIKEITEKAVWGESR